MTTPRAAPSFFQPPRACVVTSGNPANLRGLGNACPGCAPDVGAPLNGLGDWFTNILNTVQTGTMDVLDTLTGKKAERQSQEKAAAIALAQQQAAIGMTATEVTEWARWLLNQWMSQS